MSAFLIRLGDDGGTFSLAAIYVDRIKSVIHRARRAFLRETSQDYWTRQNVTLHRFFRSAAESLAYFEWRNDQYIDYIKLMPVDGQDEKVVLDYGCGPGNDLVGFGVYSKPHRLIGVDVSPTSLAQAKSRLALHGIDAELIQLRESDVALPFDDASVDYIHSSGVIHHTPSPTAILREFRRILRPGGEARIMVYNYNCLWLHLHVAYIARIVKKLYRHLSIREAFSRLADGEECPLARVYKPEEFVALASTAGFECVHIGSALAVLEFADFGVRCSAIMSPDLEMEHRRFLLDLRLDDRGLPMYNGTLAGQNGCYSLRRVL
jgi:ubiquinone/menaquinone biosynthesis C-methylase UbiE